ncbi:hypothetical protein EI94DRAFT_1705984 [Lactarius quietus]|nr:hypothetical protein EI94DRAFT_1705984 [Lactarius quietus]
MDPTIAKASIAKIREKTKITLDAEIVKQQYSILIPCIPLTFDPSNANNLHEVEECNDLSEGMIVKACWIKPVYRRAAEQQEVHVIFTLLDVTITNQCIRDSIYPRLTPVEPVEIHSFGLLATNLTNVRTSSQAEQAKKDESGKGNTQKVNGQGGVENAKLPNMEPTVANFPPWIEQPSDQAQYQVDGTDE